MTVVLCGGGPDTVTDPALVAPFAERVAGRRVGLVLDDCAGFAAHFVGEYGRLLAGVRDLVPVLLTGDADPAALDGLDGVVVGGGPTPHYHRHLRDLSGLLRERVEDGLPYLGFSAGAMIAGDVALLGGWRSGGVPVCPQEWSEGLDELDVRPGFGLLDGVVDVHGPQAGTLGRAVALVAAGLAPRALVVAEDTVLVDGQPRGRGPVWQVLPDGAGRARVTQLPT